MDIRHSDYFQKQYARAPESIKKALRKQIGFLVINLLHPSLHAKKYSEENDIWQARVTRDWRFYFSVEAGTYTLHDITPHPK